LFATNQWQSSKREKQTMKAKMKATMAIIGVCAALSPWAGAAPILQHVGANNPTTEGFNPTGGAGLEGIRYATNDNGTPAWVIQDTNAPLNSGFGYLNNLSAVQRGQLANQWHVGWTFKVAAASAPDDVTPFSVRFINTNGLSTTERDYWVKYSLTNGTDLRIVLNAGPALTVPGAAVGFHTWDLRRTNPASTVAEFYYDGAFLTNYSGFDDPGEGYYLMWVAQGADTTSLTEWTSMIVEVVPEPSSLGLIAVVAGIGHLCRRRKQ
jgi:hypothetical protein